MEKRQAVEFLEYLRQDRNLERTIYGDALNMAIEALKAQLFKESATFDPISRQATIDALDFEIVHMTAYCDGKNEGNPLAQYNKGLEDGKKAIEALPPAQPELAIPLSWIEKYIEWLKRFDNEFANLEAAHISVMVKKWRDEQDDRTD